MGRLALVTGGTRGIGRAVSIALHNAGYDVAANYAGNTKAAEQLREEHNIRTFQWDVSDYDACAKGIAKVEADFGQKIQVLVNNAGIIRDAMMHKLAPTQWHEVIDTNLTSCFNMCHIVMPHMRDVGFGRIINISSINALMGQLGQVNYAAAKAGIIGLSKSLAREGASKNITVNVVAPGYIATEMTQDIPEKVMESLIAQIPVRRLGTPDEIARCVLFLADDQAGFITGITLSANGGQAMH
jgi:acetoacetyl-CoA reductase